MSGRGELCFEEEVERLRRSGKSTDEIAQKMGVDPTWVASLVSMQEDGAPGVPEKDRGAPDGPTDE